MIGSSRHIPTKQLSFYMRSGLLNDRLKDFRFSAKAILNHQNWRSGELFFGNAWKPNIHSMILWLLIMILIAIIMIIFARRSAGRRLVHEIWSELHTNSTMIEAGAGWWSSSCWIFDHLDAGWWSDHLHIWSCWSYHEENWHNHE